jgi:hypothetical protein
MIMVLRNTEVVARDVPARTCSAVQRAVDTAVSDRADIKYYLPDRPTSPPNQIVSISCLPLPIGSDTPS